MSTKGFCNNSPPSDSKYLIFASTNQNKFFEVRTALGQTGIPLYALSDFPQIAEAPETGETFAENALQKARYYFEHFRRPVLAEDSGLVVPALGGFPGVRSARAAPDDSSRNQLVLRMLLEHAANQRPQLDPSYRNAYYICSIVFLDDHGEEIAEGRCDGVLTEAPDGDQGFGYDPIFRPEGMPRTFGRMSIKEKSQYSHRARAIHNILPHLMRRFRSQA